MLLKTLGKKKTESEYEKYIARVACSFFSLGILDYLLFALTVLVIMR